MSTSRRLTQALGLGAAAAATYYLLQYANRTPPLGRVRLIAHRGGPRYAPENTLAAFAHAVEVGAHMLECDVHLTADGEPVIIHDETLERTTNGAGWVKDKTLAELRQLDAGSGQSIPTLREYIELGRTSGVELLIEMKSPRLYPGIEARVLETLEAAGYLEMSVLQSFDWDCLRRLRQLKPSARLGALYDWGQWDVSWPAADAEYVCPMAEAVLLNPGLVRQAHAEGRGVFVWFGRVEHPLTYRYLLTFGVDGLIVDDPVALREILPAAP
jgi:glycerophosphoryl diester phosphodiesterase